MKFHPLLVLSLTALVSAGGLATTTVKAELPPLAAAPGAPLDTPLRSLPGGGDYIEAMAYSADGRLILAAEGASVFVWDAATGAPVATLLDPGGNIEDAAFSPDGTRVAVAYRGRTAKVWDVAAGKTVTTLRGHSDGVKGVRFSPDGERVLTWSGDQSARVWNAETGESIAVFPGDFRLIYAAAFSPDGTLVAVAGAGKTDSSGVKLGTVELWDIAQVSRVRTLVADSAESIRTAIFSGDGTMLYAGGAPQKRSKQADAYCWEVRSGALKATYAGHTDTIFTVEISPDKAHLLTASFDGTARIFDIAAGAPVTTFAGHAGGVITATYAPDGKTVLTAGTLTGKVPKDGTARLWDTATGAVLKMVTADPQNLAGAFFAADGQTFATGGSDGTIRIWTVAP